MTTVADTIDIFVVEDYKLTRLGITSALRNDKTFNVVGDSESAEELLDNIGNYELDVVLMDIGLPGINGIEATAKLKEKSPDTLVIMLTSHQDEEEVLASLTAGASAYCMKDIPTDKLMGVIKEVSEGAIWLDPHIAQTAMKVFQNHTLGTKACSEDDGPVNPHNLTPKEHAVLSSMVDGMSNSEIAHKMGISVHTVKAHVSSILEKLSVYDRVQAAVKAVREKLV
jgi:DNA-binding NarL/FixJ family response regulator